MDRPVPASFLKIPVEKLTSLDLGEATGDPLREWVVVKAALSLGSRWNCRQIRLSAWKDTGVPSGHALAWGGVAGHWDSWPHKEVLALLKLWRCTRLYVITLANGRAACVMTLWEKCLGSFSKCTGCIHLETYPPCRLFCGSLWKRDSELGQDFEHRCLDETWWTRLKGFFLKTHVCDFSNLKKGCTWCC